MSDPKHLIFVDYRGTSEIRAAEYVYARMAEAFGEATVFKAGDVLRPGDMFSPALMDEAAACPVMLACVGPTWLAASDPDDRRRLASPDDWLRLEISIAVEAGNRVVPLLLGDRASVAAPGPPQAPPHASPPVPLDVRAPAEPQIRRLAPDDAPDLTVPWLTVPQLIEELVELEPKLRARRRAIPPPSHQGSAATPPSPPPSSAAGQVLNSITGGTQNGPVVMGRDFLGGVTLGIHQKPK